MIERFCKVGEIELCFETFGSATDPTVLLITALGGQLVHWPAGFCGALAARGFHVVRYDNRDAGRSTWLDHLGRPTRAQLLARSGRGAVYSLEDMAADAVGLLDYLEVDAAHVAGVSLGGMIAQTIAELQPARTRSLVSISSNTGAARDQPSLLMIFGMLQRPPVYREPYIASSLRAAAFIGSRGFPRDHAALRELAGAAFDRGVHPEAAWRQLAAIFAAGDRTPRLRRIEAPAVVVHGDADRVLPLSGGEATAAAIPGARLHVIPGMGHDLPRGAWGRIVDAIADNAAVRVS